MRIIAIEDDFDEYVDDLKSKDFCELIGEPSLSALVKRINTNQELWDKIIKWAEENHYHCDQCDTWFDSGVDLDEDGLCEECQP